MNVCMVLALCMVAFCPYTHHPWVLGTNTAKYSIIPILPNTGKCPIPNTQYQYRSNPSQNVMYKKTEKVNTTDQLESISVTSDNDMVCHAVFCRRSKDHDVC